MDPGSSLRSSIHQWQTPASQGDYRASGSPLWNESDLKLAKALSNSTKHLHALYPNLLHFLTLERCLPLQRGVSGFSGRTKQGSYHSQARI